MPQQILQGSGEEKMSKGVAAIIFFFAWLICGCGIESLFGTIEQRATWIAFFVILAICAFGLRDR